jgi:glutathione S-transferase
MDRMTQYRLHCTGASGNAYKVALYLNCSGLDWEPVGVDLGAGRTHDAAWRADLNEMGEIPVLEVDGQRRSQSGAILMWLADTTGKFAPTEGERFEAIRWLLFDNHRFTNNYAMHRVQHSFTQQAGDPAVLAFLRSRVEGTFAIVEKHLANRAFVLGARPTIVDFSMAGYVYYPVEETGFDIAAQFPAIDAWRRRVAGLPGWKPPYELMPVGTSLPRRPA